MEYAKRSNLARLLADHTRGTHEGTTVRWPGISHISVRVDPTEFVVEVCDGGYTLARGLTWAQVKAKVADLVTSAREEKAAREQAYAELGGNAGARKRQYQRAISHSGGWGDPALAALTRDILNQLRAKRMGGEGIDKILSH